MGRAGTGSPGWRVRPYGDAALLVEVDGPGAVDAETRWRLVQDLGAALLADPPPGLTDVVAAFDTVVATFDPLLTDHAGLSAALPGRPARPGRPREPHELVVPVAYGGAYGPDLEEVAAELGLAPRALVALHTATPWTVRFRGSPAGAPFLDGPALPRPVARRPTPRTRVEPGSVGLSGRQSMVYPTASPGGWRLVGRTPLRLVDPGREGLVPYRPGDRLRFVEVGPQEWRDLEGHGLPW